MCNVAKASQNAYPALTLQLPLGSINLAAFVHTSFKSQS
jgi:hypothetical protein